MSGVRISRSFSILLCGVVTTSVVACNPQSRSDLAVGSHAAELDACSVAAADGEEWTSQAFPAQTQAFAVELTATPSASPIDAVLGFSAGPASWFPQLAAIVRFNPDGAIDVRAGSGYQADAAFPYTAGTSYRFHLDINVGLHIYSVAVRDALGGWTWLARSYPFRTEQAQVTQLDNVATQVDSDAGALEVCDVQVKPASLSGCPAAVAGGGFVDQVIGPPGEVVVSSDLMLGADQVLDGVFGQAPNVPASFDDLATAVRFSPDGVIDVRSRGVYQADVAMPYTPGVPRRVRIIANIPTHLYSVYVALGDFDSVRLARNYGFRTSQSTARFIGHADAIVDSTAGKLAFCNAENVGSVRLRSSRDGNFSIAPFGSGHEAVISDGNTTLHVSDDGRILGSAPFGGQVAVDPAGTTIYVAHMSDGNTAISVNAFTPSFSQRWVRGIPIGSDHRIVAVGADAASVVVAFGPTSGGIDGIKRWLVDGTDSTSIAGPLGDTIAIGRAGFATGSVADGIVTISKWSFGQSGPDWQRRWGNPAQIDGMALSAGGQVYFGGQFSGPITFDGPTLQPTGSPGNVYVVGLSSAGTQLFTSDIHQSSLHGIASNGGLTVISAHAFGRRNVVIVQSDGQIFEPDDVETTFGDAGTAGTIAIDAGNRIYWNFILAWPSTSAPKWPYMISFDP